MKKLIVMMLCLTMMGSFVGCSSSPADEEVRGEQISNEETEVENKEVEFSLGEVEGLVYENKFIGIGCELDSDWYFFNDDEIKELNNYAADVAGEEFEKLMKEADLIYDMYAVSSNQLDNININLEKVHGLTLKNIELGEALEETIPLLKDTYSGMGYTNFQGEVGTVSIEGKEHTCLSMSGEYEGLKMYQKQVPIKCDGYLAYVTVTTYEENAVDALLEKFYFVK